MQLKLALGVLPRGAHGWNFFVRVKFLLDPNLVSVPGVSPPPPPLAACPHSACFSKSKLMVLAQLQKKKSQPQPWAMHELSSAPNHGAALGAP